MSNMSISVATQTEAFITGKIAVARNGKTYSFDYRVKDGSITLFGPERQIPRNQLKDAHEAVIDHCVSLLSKDGEEDATTLPVDGVSGEPAADVVPEVETAPVSRCAEIVAGFGYNQDLVMNYRWYRQQPISPKLLKWTTSKRAAISAIEFARRDVANKKLRYPETEHPEFSAWGPRNKTVRYIPDIYAIGIRTNGPSRLFIDLNHKGWFTSENGDNSEVVQGQVFQLPGRKGKPIFVAGHSDPNNDSAATIDFGTLYTGTPARGPWEHPGGQDLEHAARAADDMARRYGEEETEHGLHWEAGARFVDLQDQHSDLRKLTLAALRELHGTSCDSRRAFVTSRYQLIKTYWTTREVIREEQAKLEAEHGGTPGFREHIED